MKSKRTGEILFAPSAKERWRKGKLTIDSSSLEIETGAVFGLMRAIYSAQLRSLEAYSRKEDVLELHLRMKSGTSQMWLVKTPEIEEWIRVLVGFGIQEKPSAIRREPVPTQQPPSEQVPPKILSLRAKFALRPGKWTSAKISLTDDGLQIETYEFLGMMPRPTRVTVELKALKSFTRSKDDTLRLHIESRPEYGLVDDWFIATKQRDELVRALLSLGVQETAFDQDDSSR